MKTGLERGEDCVGASVQRQYRFRIPFVLESGCRRVSRRVTIESVLESHGTRASMFKRSIVRIGSLKRTVVTSQERNTNRHCESGAGGSSGRLPCSSRPRPCTDDPTARTTWPSHTACVAFSQNAPTEVWVFERDSPFLSRGGGEDARGGRSGTHTITIGKRMPSAASVFSFSTTIAGSSRDAPKPTQRRCSGSGASVHPQLSIENSTFGVWERIETGVWAERYDGESSGEPT